MKSLILFNFLFLFLINISLSQVNNFTIGGNLITGNLLSYGVNLRASLSTNPKKIHQLVFNPSFDYGKISNQIGVFELRRKEILATLNYEKTKNRFKFYVYTEFEKSFLRKIQLRGAFGTGVSYKILENESVEFDFSQLILPEIFLSSFNNRRDNRAIRLSSRLRYSRRWSRFRISNQILFQPAIFTQLTDGTNVDIKNNTTIRINNSYEVTLSKNLSMGLMGEIIVQTYTNFINPSVKPYDSNFNLFIKGTF